MVVVIVIIEIIWYCEYIDNVNGEDNKKQYTLWAGHVDWNMRLAYDSTTESWNYPYTGGSIHSQGEYTGYAITSSTDDYRNYMVLYSA